MSKVSVTQAPLLVHPPDALQALPCCVFWGESFKRALDRVGEMDLHCPTKSDLA